jgi:hypothetical protein
VADLSDVETAIVTLITGLVYPGGTSLPSAVLNAASVPIAVKLARGWPVPAQLDTDLAAGAANITVYSRGSVERNTTRYPDGFQDVSLSTPTLTATVNGNQVTIGGTNNQEFVQFVTILIGPRVVVSYQPSSGDTTATIAAALAAKITAAFATATVVGSTITVPSSAYLVAEVGVTGTQIAEVRRQRTQAQITLWCPTPTIRDNIAKLIEPTLALQTFLTMPDQTAARFRYHNTVVTDQAQKVQLYRRDLIYDVEYATTVTDTATEVTAIIQNVAGGLAPALGPVNTNNMPIATPTAPVNSPNPFSPHVPD